MVFRMAVSIGENMTNKIANWDNLTEEQKQSWILYRQYLRDFPSIIQDPKPLVLDRNHTQWSLSQPSTPP